MLRLNRILIKGGRVIDPATGTDKIKDILIEGEYITDKFNDDSNVLLFDASEMIVAPGLIDMHVHLREPGREDEETILSGTRAAAAGGFTTVACMPNTDPPVDSAAVVKYIGERAALSLIDVKVVGAITKGQKGETLAEMGELSSAGAVAFSDDGRPVINASLMRMALEYSTIFNLPLISHAEDLSLANGGIMNESYSASVLGLKGIPAAAEEVMVARDIILAKQAGARLHLAHISTAGSVELVRRAKESGQSVTCEATPHHLTLTDESLIDYNTNCKVNPPLRSTEDVIALWKGLADGVIDVISTDHAPHASHEKELEIEIAPFGMIGLETALSLILTEMDKYGFGISSLIAKLSVNPARILGLKAGTLRPGSRADITIIDAKAKVEVDINKFESKSRNTPFDGRRLVGRAAHVFKDGRQIVAEGRVIR